MYTTIDNFEDFDQEEKQEFCAFCCLPVDEDDDVCPNCGEDIY